MSRNYKFHNEEGLYFVSFATVFWIDVFIREIYSEILVDSLKFCIEEKGMELGCWCIMPSHVHLIFRDKNKNPSKLLKEFKTFTSKKIVKSIEDNMLESRREWMLGLMKNAGEKNSNVTIRQFWQQHNKPIELWSSEVIDQKMNYIHDNPVVSGFVNEPHHWKYSSAIDYSGGKGMLELLYL